MPERYIEESRLDAADDALGAVLESTAFKDAADPRIAGDQLWLDMVDEDQLDDRPLYWRRLALLQQFRESGTLTEGLTELELASRGMLGDRFSGEATHRVLVTGFDPFHLDDQVEQGNPSGVLALRHEGKQVYLESGDIAEIRSMIFPVRYRDFDEFLVERVLEAQLDKLDMVITVSMGRTGFDLERFPGKRRSVATPDNLRQQGGGSAEHPVAPPHLDGPEFVEFSLPVRAMKLCTGKFKVNDNRLVTTLERGEHEAESLASLENQTAVLGSGGGYLSNEISYRVIRHLQERGRIIPAGHIHTPRMQGYDGAMVEAVSVQGSQLIEAAIRTLEPSPIPTINQR